MTETPATPSAGEPRCRGTSAPGSGLRSPGEVHYSTGREGGHVFLHAKRECSGMSEPATPLSWMIVRTLWEKDASASSTVDENDVSWCEHCATRKVD